MDKRYVKHLEDYNLMFFCAVFEALTVNKIYVFKILAS